MPGLVLGARLDHSAWSQFCSSPHSWPNPHLCALVPAPSAKEGRVSSTFSLKPCVFRLRPQLTLWMGLGCLALMDLSLL